MWKYTIKYKDQGKVCEYSHSGFANEKDAKTAYLAKEKEIRKQGYQIVLGCIEAV